MEKSQCKPLIDIAKGLYDHMRLIRFRTSAFLPRLESALDQHFELIDIFEKGDSELVEKVMRAHIEESVQYIKQWEEIHQKAVSPKINMGSKAT